MTFWLPDDWDVFIWRVDPSVASYFTPMNGHPWPVTVLVCQALLRIFGLGSFQPWLLVLSVVHVVNAWLVFGLVRRLAGHAVAFLAAIALLGLASAYEDLFGFTTISFELAVAFGLGALLLAMAQTWGPVRAAAILSLTILAVGSSGVGLLMAGCVALSQVGRRRILLTFIPLGVYVAWALLWPSHFGHPGLADPFTFGGHAALRWSMYFVGADLALVFLVGLVMLLATALVRGWRPPKAGIAAACALFALYVSVGYRAGWELSFADPARYALPAFVLGAIALASLPMRPVVVAIFMFAVVVNVPQLDHGATMWRNNSAAFVHQVDAGPLPYGITPAEWIRTVERWGWRAP
jgi:hypothetical protein